MDRNFNLVTGGAGFIGTNLCEYLMRHGINVLVIDDFWKLLDERLELCHLALQERHKRLEGTVSDISPIHWQYGALARLEKGEKIDKLLHGGYSTLSLGYAGLWECVYKLIGKKLTEEEGKELGLKIMRALNDAPRSIGKLHSGIGIHHAECSIHLAGSCKVS